MGPDAVHANMNPCVRLDICGDRERRPHQQTMRSVIALALFLLPIATSPARSSSSEWIEAEGARVRLVTTGLPDEQGNLEGALEILLAPGWKTYWRDPGETGVPPSLDLDASNNLAGATFSFPAPHRFKDDYATWAGYKEPVALPVRLTLENPTAPISANIFLGVCETICIPVQGAFQLDPAHDPESVDDAALVEAAQAQLPGPAGPDLGASIVETSPDRIIVEATLPAGTDAVDLFVSGEDGYVLGTPERIEEDGSTRFSIALIDRPASPPAAGGLPYTLVTAAGAVEGLLPYP